MIEFVTYIPLNYNNGEAISDAVISGIFDTITIQFGGCSIGAVGKGLWLNSKNEIVSDINVMLTVGFDASRVDEAREAVKNIGVLLEQDEMYFKLIDCNAEYIVC